MSDIQNNLRHSWRSFPYRQPLGMYLNLTDMADKQDSSDTEEPLRSWCHPVTLFGPPSHVSVCDAMVTTTVTGGACDLCLTNGSFIIPHATTTSPVFIALYFKLNPQQCPSIMVAHDLYWRWWLGPREGSVWILSGLPYLKRQFLWTRSAVSCTLNVKCSLTLGRQVIVAILFLSCYNITICTVDFQKTQSVVADVFCKVDWLSGLLGPSCLCWQSQKSLNQVEEMPVISWMHQNWA